jgi:hypothetical protein
VSEDAIRRKILKFVRLVDGGETEESVRRTAIERKWLTDEGEPTIDGRQLVHAFSLQSRFEENEF